MSVKRTKKQGVSKMEEPTRPMWLRVPPNVLAELEAIQSGWNETVPMSRLMLAAIRVGLTGLRQLSPHEVYGVAALGADRFGVRVTRQSQG